MNTHLIKRSQYQTMPWKNGLGSTAQIDIFPEGGAFPGEAFLWRISSATVETSCSFSNFLGCDRLLVVWKGEGLVLNDQLLPPLTPVSFSGEVPMECRLVAEEVVDVGVIYRRDQVSASMTVQNLEPRKSAKLLLNSGYYYLFCAEGSFSFLQETVESGDTLRVQGPGELELTSTVGAQFFLMQLQSRG